MAAFLQAHGGTLFLDEIGELPVAMQAKLLRVVEAGELKLLGAEAPEPLDVRVVVATNRDLQAMTANGAFRSDLYHRLAAFTLRIPPLRERPDDVPALVDHFVEVLSRQFARPTARPSPTFLAGLLAYSWPGNVRELISVLRRAVLLADDGELALPANLGEVLQGPLDRPGQPNGAAAAVAGPAASAEDLGAWMRRHVLAALQACAWRIEGSRGAARRLGLKPSRLRYRMRKLAIARTAPVGPPAP